MKHFVVVLALFCIFSCEADAQCFCPSEQMSKLPERETPIIRDSGPKTLADANELAKRLCSDSERVARLIELEGENASLAKVHATYGSVQLLRVASLVASHFAEETLAERFRLEAEIISSHIQANNMSAVTDIWLRNAASESSRLLKGVEPFKTLTVKLSASYAREVAGNSWFDAVAFQNFKILSEEYTGKRYEAPFYWAAFKLIPPEDFVGKRSGMQETASFSSADRMRLELFQEVLERKFNNQ